MDRCGEELRIQIVGDWSRCRRGNSWLDVLKDLDRRRLIPNTADVYPLADWVWQPVPDRRRQRTTPVPGESLLQILFDTHVLILNWDVANGDPDFGADLAMRWLTHRRPELLHWVREHGGILIIESETRLGVPAQGAYDALLGESQVVVCGEEDPLKPRRQIERNGSQCKMTGRARTPTYFTHLKNLSARQRSFDEMFPGIAGRILSPFLSVGPWQVLYRGWFRWNPFKRTRLPWVPFVKTADRRFNHPTMLAAKLGRGAVFVSTMLLASSGQSELIEAMLRCHGDVDRLPDPPRRIRYIRKWVLQNGPPILAGATAALIAQNLAGWQGIFGGPELLRDFLRFVLLAGLAVLVAVIVYLIPRLRRLIRDAVGW